MLKHRACCYSIQENHRYRRNFNTQCAAFSAKLHIIVQLAEQEVQNRKTAGERAYTDGKPS